MRLERAQELFEALGLARFKALYQMNPDLTVNFETNEAASAAAEKIAGVYVNAGHPLFHVERRGKQLFLELEMPQPIVPRETQRIRHTTATALELSLGDFVKEHGTNDQSTAHHKDIGFCIAWSPRLRVEAPERVAPVTSVAPAFLDLFGVSRPAWLVGAAPAFRVSSAN